DEGDATSTAPAGFGLVPVLPVAGELEVGTMAHSGPSLTVPPAAVIGPSEPRGPGHRPVPGASAPGCTQGPILSAPRRVPCSRNRSSHDPRIGVPIPSRGCSAGPRRRTTPRDAAPRD